MNLYCFVSLLSAFFFCNKTKWFSCLHLVVLFPFLLFWFECCFSLLFQSSQKRTQRNGHGKPPPPPPKKCRKKAHFFQFAQLCSRIMFLIFWCGLKMRNFAENTIKSGFSIFRKGQKWPKNVKKVESTIGPSMLRNILGPIFDSKKW